MQDIISQQAREEITRRLRAAEQEHDVRILLAVESGSRAWGFASPDSDYDARFIYVHRPEWYLSVGLEEKRDVIEYPIVDEMDINGWDIRKALRLFWKSNPAFVEWMLSPVQYEKSGCFHQEVLNLMPTVYSVENGMYHYRSSAKTNFRTELQSELVRYKKYFYVLRPLLATRWLERYQTPAPIEFDKLMTLINDQPELTSAIADLLEKKKRANESELGPQVPVIHQFIAEELARLDAIVPPRFTRTPVEPQLSALFRKVLQQTWGE